ncbi:hypothetical protein GCM10025876_21180 [Demequina litorisediminis]|uniref:2-C-methyl-D-erythritol 4-phosphate cytidylyltransferase n=1 Tax=Demequina litorisediminis TaxID=1849022 RepID=A0ABQ6IDY1_9MICO|nr:hypothetical protein GCM10025876_21180 [Demequina litorisediminis]
MGDLSRYFGVNVISLLLLNGGVGARAKTAGPKQFVKINGVPILVYSLKEADEVEAITQIVVNYPAGHRDTVEQIVKDYAIATPVVYAEAGTTRQESVARLLDEATNDVVMIHESARPLVRAADFRALAESAHANVGFMREISFTVAPVDPETQRVTGSLERARLRNVQASSEVLEGGPARRPRVRHLERPHLHRGRHHVCRRRHRRVLRRGRRAQPQGDDPW